MTQPTFKYVEHYIEFIGGSRDHSGVLLNMFEYMPSPINLARYDVKIIQSLSIQTAEMQRPYTDKQAELAIKIIEKYRRQLLNLNPPVYLPEKLNEFQYGIRSIDRSKTVRIVGDEIQVKFPYDTKILSQVRKLVNEGYGRVNFDSQSKVWHFALTEWMLNWVIAVLPQNEFIFDESVLELYKQMIQVEQQDFKIILEKLEDKLYLKNATANLTSYINDNLGGFGLDNLLTLVDYSSVLNYLIDPYVKNQIVSQYPEFQKFILNREIRLSSIKFNIDKLLEYAKLTNRLPVYFYDTGVPQPSNDQIVYINQKAPNNLEAKLLVTKTPLMIGSKKQSWLATAEKIVILE